MTKNHCSKIYDSFHIKKLIFQKAFERTELLSGNDLLYNSDSGFRCVAIFF